MELTPISAATALNNATGVAKAASLMMLDKTLDTNQSMGAAMVSMMEQSVNLGVGGNVDVKL